MNTRVAIVGVMGRMGRAVLTALADCDDIEVVGGVERPGHPALGTPCGSGEVTNDLAGLLGGTDVVVDFALPDGLAERVLACVRTKCPLVTGVTGLDERSFVTLRAAAGDIAVVHAPNFSIGVNVMSRLAVEARRLLGDEYDVEIVETHHREKRDAPSGTAARLLEAILEAGEVSRVRNGRCGLTGAKDTTEVAIHSVRTGDVVGDHTVVFGGPGERLELTHRATSRQAFARGVVAAVRFCAGRAPGFYGMADVLGAGR